MNWTGGSLQRTKNANKGILQKQKAYFARTRTQLQNSTNVPGIRFRPSYPDAEDNLDPARHMPSFFRQSERSSLPKQKARQVQRSISSRDKAPMHSDDFSLRMIQGRSIDMKSNTEARLLEANRKRLLGQPDWIGIAPSKPVNLRCLRNREKDKIGKRRKVKSNLFPITRPVKPAKGLLPQSLGASREGNSTFRATHDVANHIQIQIGSNALTTTHSMKSNDVIQSSVSSEPMLFDQETQDGDLESAEMLPFQKSTALWQGTSASLAEESFHQVLRQGSKLESHQLPPRHTKGVCGQTKRPSLYAYWNKEQPDESFVRESQTKGGSSDKEQSLPFASRNSYPPAIASRNQYDDMGFVEEFFPFGETQSGRTSCDRGDIGRSSVPDPPIVASGDGKPWRSFLAISGGSSGHFALRSEANDGAMRTPSTMGSDKAIPNWSQQATGGFPTLDSMPSVSASLRSFRKPVNAHTPCERLDTPGSLGNKNVRNLADDERLWQAFVFGNDDNLWSDRQYDGERSYEREISPNLGESSGHVPLSAVVSPVSSVPAQTFFRLPSSECHNAHNVADIVPHSEAQTVVSPDIGKFTDESSDERRSCRMAVASPFGGRSVAAASLQNNPSYTDRISPKDYQNTRFCNGLDRSK